MLREDKNVTIQPLEVVADPHGELETPSQIEQHIEAYRNLVDSWKETLRLLPETASPELALRLVPPVIG